MSEDIPVPPPKPWEKLQRYRIKNRTENIFASHWYNEECDNTKIIEALSHYPLSQDETSRVLLVPNGAYRYSARAMAASYSKVCPENIKRVFIFGRFKDFMPYKCGISEADRYSGMHYDIFVDYDVVDDLYRSGGFVKVNRTDETKERFIEMQLPFIAKMFENYHTKYRIIPIYVGALSHDQLTHYGRKFANYLKDPANLFIFSTSLVHWGEIYNYTGKLAEDCPIINSLMHLSVKASESLTKVIYKDFDNFVMDNKANVPDRQVIGIMLWMVHLMHLDEITEASKLEPEDKKKLEIYYPRWEYRGQAVSFPTLEEKDSCISYISGVIHLEKSKYMPPDEEPVYDPLINKNAGFTL